MSKKLYHITPPPAAVAARHAQGLALVAQVLQAEQPYAAVLALEGNPAVDPALRSNALAVAAPISNTTISLEMTMSNTCSILLALCLNFDQLWGDLGGAGLPTEDDLSRVGDYARAIDYLAAALSRTAMENDTTPA